MVSKKKRLALIDRYLAENTFATMEEAQIAVDAALKPSVKRKQEGTRDENGQMFPNDMGDLILKRHRITRDKNGICYEYDFRYWKELTLSKLQSYALLADDHWSTTARRRAETISYMGATSQAEGDIPWGALPDNEVPLWSGVLNFETGEQRPHNPDDWLEAVVPHSWHAEANCPTWLDCLARWFYKDLQWEQKTDALQEFFGYCLLCHAKYKKALVCLGEPNTGKSVVTSVMTEMVGKENTCSIAVEDMDDPRKVAPIRGKMLNVMSDLTSKSLIADGGFKRLVSTGDAIQVDAKYAQPELYIPTAKHAVATNILPRVDDKTWGTFERLLVIRFPNVIPKEEMNRNLLLDLLEEMPGILRWAILGAHRLLKNQGQFTTVRESEDILAEFRQDQNPVFSFIEEETVDGEYITFSDLWEKFGKWYAKPVSRMMFGRWVAAAGIKTSKKRFANGTTQKIVKGYAWPY